jgi:NTP pyrophosphatase (non-canonical NTP hydrolase)
MISAETLEKLLKFRKDRDWEQFHTFKNLAISISLEAAELLEHVQWAADSQVADTVARKINEVSAEIADIAIYLSYLAHDLGIDLEQTVQKKLLTNEAKYPVDKAKGTALKYDQFL